jgi:hypothetical protein
LLQEPTGAADHDDEDSDVAEHAPWAGGGAGSLSLRLV